MNVAEIYAKTDLGVREIKDRQLNLPLSLRTLLIIIDGQRTVGEVLDKARAFKVNEKDIEALALNGLIAPKFATLNGAANDDAAQERSADEVDRYLKAQKLMNDAIHNHLGIRGYALMMRLQRADDVRALHELLRDVAAALVKRIGVDAATPVVAEIESLLVVARQ